MSDIATKQRIAAELGNVQLLEEYVTACRRLSDNMLAGAAENASVLHEELLRRMA